MKVLDCSTPLPATVPAPLWHLDPDGTRRDAERELQAEHCLDVVVNGTLVCRMVCTPEHLVELAVGRLYADGVIDGAGDVASVRLCRHSRQAVVELVRPVELAAPRAPTVPSHCSDDPAHAVAVAKRPLAPLPPARVEPAWLEALAARFALDTPMHKRTRGAHSCTLAVEGDALFTCEDLGRHNAFDKAVGHALLHGVDLGRALVLTSGRVPADMASKAVYARVPVLLTAAVPTDLAVRIARDHGLTLVGIARRGGLDVYSDPTGALAGRPAQPALALVG